MMGYLGDVLQKNMVAFVHYWICFKQYERFCYKQNTMFLAFISIYWKCLSTERRAFKKEPIIQINGDSSCPIHFSLILAQHVILLTLDTRDNGPLLDSWRLLKTIGIDSPEQSLAQAHLIEAVHDLIPVALWGGKTDEEQSKNKVTNGKKLFNDDTDLTNSRSCKLQICENMIYVIFIDKNDSGSSQQSWVVLQYLAKSTVSLYL